MEYTVSLDSNLTVSVKTFKKAKIPGLLLLVVIGIKIAINIFVNEII
ncbi:MAG: hypothetical protein PHE79_06645 [Eubacteriales bacterium]|nr:hypothetical protein [Eubacteriales bacterium]